MSEGMSEREAAELRKQAEAAHLDATNLQTRVSELEAENAELRERMEKLKKALAKLENFLEVTATYAVSRPKRDYAQFVLETLRADFSTTQSEESQEDKYEH